MAKLASWKLVYKNELQDIRYVFGVMVNSYGRFQITISKDDPNVTPELLEFLKGYPNDLTQVEKFHEVQCGKTSAIKYMSYTLDTAKNVVIEALRNFRKKLTETTLVISYCIETSGRYWEGDSGNIYPTSQYEENGVWVNKNYYYNHTSNLHVRACCLKCLDYGGVIKYEKPTVEELPDEAAISLNDWDCYTLESISTAKVIPYSEKAAKYFCELIESIYRTHSVLSKKLGNEENALAYIEKMMGDYALQDAHEQTKKCAEGEVDISCIKF